MSGVGRILSSNLKKKKKKTDGTEQQSHPNCYAHALVASPHTRWNPPEVSDDRLCLPPWVQAPLAQLRSRLSKVNAGTIKSYCDMYAAPDHAPKLKTERYHLIVDRFRAHSLYLLSLSNIKFTKEYIALLPQALPDPRLLRDKPLKDLLRGEFGDEILEQLISLPTSEIAKGRNKRVRRERHAAAVSDSRAAQEAYIQSWPQVVPKDVVYECLNAYYKGTQWMTPSVSCVCSRQQRVVKMHNIVVSSGGELPNYLEILRTDVNPQFPADEFQFIDPRFNGLMSDQDGVQVTQSQTTLQVCHPCHGYLPRSLMPRFALANKLYRGCLPEQFQNLMWIEERVCAKYTNTATVTRFYQSSDPSQPAVFHGNTRTHEMSVSSTATVLPRALADVNGLLSVVFIGPSKFKPEHLGNMYRVRKSKVWNFLQWLKTHNRLYADVLLDERAINLYPDDGYLPGIDEAVIHDERAKGEEMSKEETAGISEHPAELFNDVSGESGTEPPRTMIEKTGVADPECDQVPGRLFTSAALKNLVSDDSELPDLVLHRGSAAVPEYGNPDLLTGMYPTLFPAGTGGFNIPDRVCAISFVTRQSIISIWRIDHSATITHSCSSHSTSGACIKHFPRYTFTKQ